MINNNYSALAQLLRSRRAELGLKLSEVSRRSGIDKSVISRIENDQNPRVRSETLRALGLALQLSTSDVLTAAERMPATELPTLRPYMRAKYTELPEAAVDEVEQFITELQRRHGLGPVGSEEER